MPTQYILAPNGRWSAFDQTGFAAINGKVWTYQNQTRDPKTTYQDPGGTLPNTNPVSLNSRGEANIYWADDDFYTIVVYSSTGELLYTQDNYPNVGSGSSGDIILNELSFNLVRNAQFTLWGNLNYLDSAENVVFSRLGLDDVICIDFNFRRSNTNATVQISQNNFNKGQSDVPANPISYLTYTCTDIGSGGETYKEIYQTYKSAQFLSNTECSIGIWGVSPISNTISVDIVQNFGTGGSPSAPVATNVLTANLTPSSEQYTATITIPDVSGKNFGTDGNDRLELVIRLPLNAIANLSVSNLQFHAQNTLPSFPKLPPDDQIKRTNFYVDEAVCTTGDRVFSIASSKGDGWIKCNDGTIGSSFSAADYASNKTLQLYKMLWQSVPEIYVPMFDSAGVPVSRGASYLADFNADKRMALTKTLGRAFGAKGPVSGSMRFTVDTTVDALIVGDTAGFYTGNQVRLTTTGTLPAPLAINTTYYVIKASDTLLKLAATLENAIIDSSIDITNSGSGIHTVSLFNSDSTALGQFAGEAAHALISNEVPTTEIQLPIGVATSSSAQPLRTSNYLSTDASEPFNADRVHPFVGTYHSTNPPVNILGSVSGGNSYHNNVMPIIYENCFLKL
jgi:hypothetical protein